MTGSRAVKLAALSFSGACFRRRSILAAVLSIPDADQLARLLVLGPVWLKLALDCGWSGRATSYNVIGQITGRSKPGEIVLTGGHLDSWDLGTGAIDDAAGIGISMAAAHLISRLPQQARAHDPRGRLRQ
jgi:hypothetical protein